jgi:hypothetical protein
MSEVNDDLGHRRSLSCFATQGSGQNPSIRVNFPPFSGYNPESRPFIE